MRKARASESGRSVAPPQLAGIAEAMARSPGLHAARELGQPAAATASWHDARAHAHRIVSAPSLSPLLLVVDSFIPTVIIPCFAWVFLESEAPIGTPSPPFPLAVEVAADARARRRGVHRETPISSSSMR